MNRKLLAFIASGALALPMAAQAVDVSVSGHINRAVMFGDDILGNDDVTHKDGGASPSRFRFTGSEELDGGMTAGVNLEYGAGAAGSASPWLRHSAVYLSGAFGKLTLGQTSPASDGVPYSNYDNNAFLAGIEIACDFCTGLPAYGGSRTQIARYDTPALGPATVAVSGDGEKFFDAALRVDADAGGSKYQLKAGYGSTDDAQKNFAMSGAVGFANGAHLNAAWGQTDPDKAGAEKLSYWHIGLGYNFGNSSIAATYTDHEAGVGFDEEGDPASESVKVDGLTGGTKSWGIGVGHKMGSMQLYAGYKHLNLERDATNGMTGTDRKDLSDHGFFVVGSRVTFN